MARERHFPNPPWGIMHGTDAPPPQELYPPRLVWIEGRVRIDTHDELYRDMLAEVYPLLNRLGFHVHEQMITIEDDAEGKPVRRRFSPTNVPLDHVVATVTLDPGHDALYYANELFRTEPWTDFTIAAAKAKFHRAVIRAGTTKLRKFYAPKSGRVLFGPPDWSPAK